ncbi:hypothetical protein SRHO_G00081720 [Serrasalmus rhombeus]
MPDVLSHSQQPVGIISQDIKPDMLRFPIHPTGHGFSPRGFSAVCGHQGIRCFTKGGVSTEKWGTGHEVGQVEMDEGLMRGMEET